MIHRETRGVYIIAATPFAEDGALDLAGVDRLVAFYEARGVCGITILGVMGEAPKLAPEEARAVAGRFLARARVPVVVGVSAPGLDALAGLGRFAMDQGAAGVMVAPPTGLGPEDRVRAYVHDVCEALGDDVPLCLQDYPQLTGVKLSVDTILRLTREAPQLVMLKHEDWPGLAKLSRVRAESGSAETPRLSILCGNSGLFLPQEMARGADGAMTGFAFPEMLVGVVEKAAGGDHDAAEDLFDAYLPLIRHDAQPGLGLALRKETLRRRGALASARARAPAPQLTPQDHEELTRLIARMEARVAALAS
jgi:4-hydroxy-tetrahydrodipicolinate synthase